MKSLEPKIVVCQQQLINGALQKKGVNWIEYKQGWSLLISSSVSLVNASTIALSSSTCQSSSSCSAIPTNVPSSFFSRSIETLLEQLYASDAAACLI